MKIQKITNQKQVYEKRSEAIVNVHKLRDHLFDDRDSEEFSILANIASSIAPNMVDKDPSEAFSMLLQVLVSLEQFGIIQVNPILYETKGKAESKSKSEAKRKKTQTQKNTRGKKN